VGRRGVAAVFDMRVQIRLGGGRVEHGEVCGKQFISSLESDSIPGPVEIDYLLVLVKYRENMTIRPNLSFYIGKISSGCEPTGYDCLHLKNIVKNDISSTAYGLKMCPS
jgi:hypothetical protein